MNLEELTKTQIILLAVLVSFVTSIATGIMAASMLNEVPGTVGQTVHKVVERTVEKVVPSEDSNMAAAGNTTKVKETTVVVKENDMIMDAIKENTNSLVRVYEVSDSFSDENSTSTEKANDEKKRDFTGMGIVVSEDGLIVLPNEIYSAEKNYEVDFYNGESFEIEYTEVSGENLELVKILSEEEKFQSAKIVNPDILKIGRNVITLSGKERDAVAIGIISRFSFKDVFLENEESGEYVERISKINTDIDSFEVLSGSPLITIFSEVVGIATASCLEGKLAEYIPSYEIKDLISNYKNIKKDNNSKEEGNENTSTE